MPARKKASKTSSSGVRSVKKFRELEESILKERKAKNYILETPARARLREELGEAKLNQIEKEILKLER